MFGGSMMGDGFDDIMGGHMRQMQNMMSSFFGNPFAGNDMFGAGGGRSRSMSLMPFDEDRGMMSPFGGFPNMNQLMRGMGQMPQMSSNPNCHSFSSSSVMTMTTGPDGKPQVYQASQSTRAGPNGVRETKKSVSDSRTGVKKLAIGHHIGERAHIKEKEQNVYSGQCEENEEYINLDEEEADQFNREWTQKAQHYRPRSSHQAIGYRQPTHGNQNEYLALPPAPRSKYSPNRKNYKSSNSRTLSDSRYRALPAPITCSSTEPEHNLKEESQQKKKDHRSKPYNKRKEKKNHQ